MNAAANQYPGLTILSITGVFARYFGVLDKMGMTIDIGFQLRENWYIDELKM